MVSVCIIINIPIYFALLVQIRKICSFMPYIDLTWFCITVIHAKLSYPCNVIVQVKCKWIKKTNLKTRS